MTSKRKEAAGELRKRTLEALREQGIDLWRKAIIDQVIASMTRKQRMVLEEVEKHGIRYLALLCGRRAGKTTFIAKLIIIKLLQAGHKQAVYYVAESLQVGKDIIWLDIEREVRRYFLDEVWKITANECRIVTPEGGLFRILGLNKEKQGNMTRGTKPILFAIDECQNYGHLLEPTLTSVGPGLADHKGVFVAAGTGGWSEDDPWAKITETGYKGFTTHNWTIRDNERFPRDPDEVLREEMERNGYTDEHPDYLREWMGVRAKDFSKFVLEFMTGRNTCDELPDHYGEHWRHVVGMDFGHDDAITWEVVAADPFGPDRVVLWSEAVSGLDELPEGVGLLDFAAEKTAAISTRFKTKYFVCDPGGGGKAFFEGHFNPKYGKTMGLIIRAAKKLGKAESVDIINNDLRTGRLKFYRPDSDTRGVVRESRSLQWKDRSKGEIYTNPAAGVTDNHFDGTRYALVEIGPWVPRQMTDKDAFSLAMAKGRLTQEQIELAERNAAARKAKQQRTSSISWRR